MKSGAIRDPPDYNEADVSLLKGATDATDADDYGESSTSTLDGEAYVITDAADNHNSRHNRSGEAYVITDDDKNKRHLDQSDLELQHALAQRWALSKSNPPGSPRWDAFPSPSSPSVFISTTTGGAGE